MIFLVVGVRPEFAKRVHAKIEAEFREHRFLMPTFSGKNESVRGIEDYMRTSAVALEAEIAQLPRQKIARFAVVCCDSTLLTNLENEWRPHTVYSFVPVRQPDRVAPAGIPMIVNGILSDIRDKVRYLSRLLDEFSIEISRPTKAALCLPLRNFDSVEISDLIKQLSEPEKALALTSIDQVRREIEARSGYHTIRERGQNLGVFVRTDNVRFKTPGRELHGQRRLESPGGDSCSVHCRLAGVYRFGCPLMPGFHFDCDRSSGEPLKVELVGCHNQPEKRWKVTHANIFPNDYVR